MRNNKNNKVLKFRTYLVPALLMCAFAGLISAPINAQIPPSDQTTTTTPTPKPTTTPSSTASSDACTVDIASQACAQLVASPKINGKYVCGDPADPTYTAINIGCKHTPGSNPIIDMAFAIIRFLSAGVGLVVVGSLVFAGIQYTTSRGDPSATAAAVNRIRSSVVAMLIFIFGYAILNYVIPAGFFHL